MRKILFILFLGFCFLANGQIHISSSSQNSFQLRTKKLGAFYVTKIEQNNNGKKSEKCIINGNEIDCDLISKCKKGNCDELENYLIKKWFFHASCLIQEVFIFIIGLNIRNYLFIPLRIKKS